MKAVKIQLSTMMFLEYFILGSWFVTMGSYLTQTLKFSGTQVGLCYGCTAIAAMVSPLMVGTLADRYFHSEKLLATLNWAGTALLLLLSQCREFAWFYPVLLAYTLVFIPTMALTNSIAFRHLTNPSAEFPAIRVLGTIGWILAGIWVSFMKWETHHAFFVQAALGSLMMAVQCRFLPKTPPMEKGPTRVIDILGLDAIRMLKDREFLIFIITAGLTCVPLTFYNNLGNAFLNDIGFGHSAAKQTLGQVSEIGLLLLMPWFIARFSFKFLLASSLVCWIVRYLLFSFSPDTSHVWMLYTSIFLHGVCFNFFFMTGQIYLQLKAPPSMKTQAQALHTFTCTGVGSLLGSLVAGLVLDHSSRPGPSGTTIIQWQDVWLFPAIWAAVVLVFFLIAFHQTPTSREP